MSGFFTSMGQAVLAVVLSFLVLTVVVSFPRMDPTAPVVGELYKETQTSCLAPMLRIDNP